MDRRAVFFVGAALLAALMYPIADPGQRWVAVTVAVVYLVLALLSWLDFRSRRAARRDDD